MRLDQPYTVLLLEDSEPDAFLLQRQLERILPQVKLHVAPNQVAYERMLKTLSPDLILSDYRLPQYSGIEALMYARAHAPVVPFVFVTGALHNEELAADTILKGASGFVLKNNLAKLETLLPELFAGQPAQVTPPAKPAEPDGHEPDGAAVAHVDELSADLAQADAETLAQIRQILAAQKSN